MTEHVREWKLRFIHCKIIADSHNEDGKWLKTISAEEIERRLNEYETLKKATERLSAEDARFAAGRISSHPEVWDDDEGTIAAQLAYADILEGK